MSNAAVTQHPFHENGQKIRRARKLLKSPRPAANHKPDRPISHQDFSEVIGCSLRQLIRLENGEHLPRAALRDRIVEATGTTEQIEAADDDEEEAALIRALTRRLGTYTQSGRISWRDLYDTPSLRMVTNLRREALHNLATAQEIEEALS